MEKPNFLIFVMDVQGTRNMSCYGYRRKTTPNIDRIAEEGVLFENHFTPGVWTLPTHASLFTGKYVCGHGCGVGHEYLEPDFPTLAEVLNDHGYHTAGFTNNGMWVIDEDVGIARGFKEYTIVRHAKPVPPFTPQPGNPDKGSWKTVGLVRKWLDEHAQDEKPFLLFINCTEPHMKYWPPNPFRRQFLLDGVDEEYAMKIPQDQFLGTAGKVVVSPDDWEIVKSLRDGETACLDHRMGLIFDYMRELGILDDTVLFILGDHGDTNGEHGLHTAHCQVAIWDTLLHTPLIVRGPNYFPSKTRIEHIVQTVDIFPTILEMAGIEDKKVWKEMQGKSLLSALDGPVREFAMAEVQKPTEPFVIIASRYAGWDPRTFNYHLKCARTLKYKYIWSSNMRDELYNIVEDPYEQNNIISEKPEIAEELRKKLEDFLLSLDRKDYGDYFNVGRFRRAGAAIAPEILERLKAWGLLRDIIGAKRKTL